MKLKIGESKKYVFYCIFEGKCSCLYEGGEFTGDPAIGDCIANCSSCAKERKV